MKLILLIYLLPLFTFSQIQIGNDINGTAENDPFDPGVSISSDGSIIAIGSSDHDGNRNYSGHVRVFVNINGIWTQKGNGIDGEAANDRSGINRTISLSANGSVVAIGASFNDSNYMDSGHVRVYEFMNENWIQIGDDIDGEAKNDYFGQSVSISSDGTILAAGGGVNDHNGSASGHVRIYKNINNTWIQIGSHIKGGSTRGSFGASVSLSSDGNIVAIGDPINDNNTGLVRVFENTNNTWVQIGNDIEGEEENDFFSRSISLSSDGSIVAIGTGAYGDIGTYSGYVRIFENVNDIWTQIGNDIEAAVAGDASGEVSISSDGSIIAIGAAFNDGNGNDSGHVRIFRNINRVWTRIGDDIEGEAANDLSGGIVSLSSDGSIVAIGANGNDGNGTDSGHVRVYDLSSVLSNSEFLKSDFKIFPNPALDYVHIKIPNNYILNIVNIYNNIGQLVFTGNKPKIRTSNFKKGHYIFEIVTNNGKTYEPIIIN